MLRPPTLTYRFISIKQLKRTEGSSEDTQTMLTVLLRTGGFLKILLQVERASYLIPNYLPPAPYPLWFYGLKRYKLGSSLLKIHFNLAGKLKSDMTTCDRGPWAVVIKAKRELWRWRKVRSLQAGCNHHPHTWPRRSLSVPPRIRSFGPVTFIIVFLIGKTHFLLHG